MSGIQFCWFFLRVPSTYGESEIRRRGKKIDWNESPRKIERKNRAIANEHNERGRGSVAFYFY